MVGFSRGGTAFCGFSPSLVFPVVARCATGILANRRHGNCWHTLQTGNLDPSALLRHRRFSLEKATFLKPSCVWPAAHS